MRNALTRSRSDRDMEVSGSRTGGVPRPTEEVALIVHSDVCFLDGIVVCAARLRSASRSLSFPPTPSVAGGKERYGKSGPGRPPTCEERKYRRRNVIEGCVGRLKERRRIATRYQKKASHYKAMVLWAFVGEYLKW